jgi:hypothetical protein
MALLDDLKNEKTININSENVNVEKTAFLGTLSDKEIAKIFTNLGNRTLVIPIGFPQAGKSLLLSSLLYYAQKGDDPLFSTTPEKKYPFDKGEISHNQMIEYFEKGKLWETNARGTLDLMGITIEPINDGLPHLNLAFLDLAGEDIKQIQTKEGAEFSSKINAVFNGLRIDNSPIVFVLITPFEPAIKDEDEGSLQNAHNREDVLHYDFLNYMEQIQKELTEKSIFFIVVSQWDKNPDKNMNVATFIKEKRRSIYNFVKNRTVVWGEYSIGKILVTKVGNVVEQEIVRKNHEYPSRFWKKLYHITTGKNLDYKPWWKRIF